MQYIKGESMEKPVLEKKVGDYTCKVFMDESPESPEDWDTVGTLMTFHRDCTIQGTKEFKTQEAFKEFLRKGEHNNTLIIAPVYAYIHFGVALSQSNDRYPFTDPWDACQIGVIYCTKAKAKKEFKTKTYTKTLEAFAREIETWNQYMSGEVYGFTVEGKDGEDIDSCWGYYDTPENVMKEAEASAKAEKEAQRKKHGEQLDLIKS
jgi:hypothetical protein